jgi:superfamily II DNA helicase RecQ
MGLSDRITHPAGYKPKHEQLEVIKTFQRGTDVIFCAPTGYGKRLTYQCALDILEGKVIPVTPLLSLLQNNLDKAERFGLCSSLSSQTSQQNHNNSKFLFTTAESLLDGKSVNNMIY